MRKFKHLALVSTAVLTLSLGGAARGDDEHHHRRVSVRVVTVAPPAPRIVATHEPAPSADYVWTDGYWDYADRGWRWVDGRWVRPPEPGVTWVRPEYVQVEGGWRYVPGRWSSDEIYDDHGKYKHKEKHHKHHKDHDRDDDD